MITTLLKKYFHIVLFLTLNLIILTGCNQNSDQRDFEQQAFSEPSGITVTNQNGDIVGNNDLDDWRIAPFFQGDIELISPPSPNPVLSNGDLIINIQVYFLERISGIYILVYQHSPRLFRFVDAREQVLTGTTTFTIDANIISGGIPNPQGLYRIIIQDENENVITYGDVEIM